MIDKKKMVSRSRHDGWHKPLVIQTSRINIYLIMSCFLQKLQFVALFMWDPKAPSLRIHQTKKQKAKA